MPKFHGIVAFVSGWVRVLTGVELHSDARILQEFQSGSYVPAFLDHFFRDQYRVEVRRINNRYRYGESSSPPITNPVYESEVIRWSSSTDQTSVRIKGSKGWLSSFNSIGLVILNSKKMSKRLVEIVRLTSMWLYRSADNPLKVEVIDHKAFGFPDCYVDGISAIDKGTAIRCVLSNKQATRRWRFIQIMKIRTGETSCVVFRMLTEHGIIKGNALVLPRRMMNGFNVRTFEPNIKPEIKTTGWQWVTIDPTYGAIPVKSDDLTHSIYRRVHGLYDDDTLLSTLEEMLKAFFQDLQDGKRSDWLNKLADSSSQILHDEDAADRYASERGLVGRIQVAVGQLAAVGVPLTASQTLMYLSVSGLRQQMLGRNEENRVWTDKSRHWFPVPWAYAAHIYSAEVLSLFGYNVKPTNYGFYHKATHGFVVSGKFFEENLSNHGGPDFDDTVKVHIRNVVMSDGKKRKMAFLLRNPNDFGEWSMIPVRSNGPVFHAYGESAPTVSMEELEFNVPQFSKLRRSLNIGTLPCVTNKTALGSTFSLVDEERVRKASLAFPGGVGRTVIPKMIWYANTQDIMRNLVASNEDVIDALEQGQAGVDDIALISNWVNSTFKELAEKLDYNLDAFWYWSRLPKKLQETWTPGEVEDSPWVSLHLHREVMVRTALKEMETWLNSQVTMPDVLKQIVLSGEEIRQTAEDLWALKQLRLQSTHDWVTKFSQLLRKADEENGEEYTDRKILRLAYWSFKAKEMEPGTNHDQWLYSFTSRDEDHPYEWYVRALSRIQNGTYTWS